MPLGDRWKNMQICSNLGHWAAFQVIHIFWWIVPTSSPELFDFFVCFLRLSPHKYLISLYFCEWDHSYLPQTESFLQTIHFFPYNFVQAIFLSVNFLWSKGGHYFFCCKTHKCVKRKRATDCKNIILKGKTSINIKLL